MFAGLVESNYNNIIDSFEKMGLNSDLLHGVYKYGFEGPSALQQRAMAPAIQGSSREHDNNTQEFEMKL